MFSDVKTGRVDEGAFGFRTDGTEWKTVSPPGRVGSIPSGVEAAISRNEPSGSESSAPGRRFPRTGRIGRLSSDGRPIGSVDEPSGSTSTAPQGEG